MNYSYRLAAIVPLAIGASLASAQVAFSDFGSDSNSATFGYNGGTGWTVGSTGGPVGLWMAGNQFTSAASGVLTDLIIPIGLVSGPDGFQVQLMNDSGGTVGSTVLESWTLNSNAAFGSWALPTTLAGNGSATLANGTAYWVVVTSTAANWGAWNWSDNNAGAGTSGVDAYNTGTGWNYQNSTLGAFQIDVKPAPEPASMAALLFGAGALIARKRRARS